MTTKNCLINDLYSRTLLNRKQSKHAVETILNTMKQALSEHDKVTIRGLGEFRILHKAERIGLNPKTGEHCPVAARSVVSYKASKILKDRVNNGGGR